MAITVQPDESEDNAGNCPAQWEAQIDENYKVVRRTEIDDCENQKRKLIVTIFTT